MQHSLTSNPNMWSCCQIGDLVGQIWFQVWRQHVWNFHGKLPWTTNSVLWSAPVRPLGGRIKEFPLYYLLSLVNLSCCFVLFCEVFSIAICDVCHLRFSPHTIFSLVLPMKTCAIHKFFVNNVPTSDFKQSNYWANVDWSVNWTLFLF